MKHKILHILLVSTLYSGCLMAQDVGYKRSNYFNSKENAYMEIGGRIHFQSSFFWENVAIQQKNGKSENGSEFRRIYFDIKGLLFKNIRYKFQFGFLNGKIGIRDTHIEFLDLPFFDNLKIGRFKEPISLEANTSSNHITFIERSMNTDFSLKRNNGIQLNKQMLDDKFNFIIGFFQNSNKLGKSSFSNNNITTKITYLPVYKNAGATFIHLGFAYSYRNPKNSTMIFNTQPEDNLAQPYLLKTLQDIDKIMLANFELTLQRNALCLQSEYLHYTPKGDFSKKYFDAFFVEISYFLTKEYRNFSKITGNFRAIQPRNNYDRNNKKYGAFQLGFRVSKFNLNQTMLNNYSTVLNWYLNPNTRVSSSLGVAEIPKIGISKIVKIKIQIIF